MVTLGAPKAFVVWLLIHKLCKFLFQLKKLRSDDSTDGSKSRKGLGRLNSGAGALKNAAKRMFKKARSDTDETTTSETDDKRSKG